MLFVYFYLKLQVTDSDFFGVLFDFQMPVVADTGPDQSQEPWVLSGSPTRVTGTQILETG